MRTFVATDIVGSTELLRTLGLRYAERLQDHRSILGRIARDHRGDVVDSVGDGSLLVFRGADDALAAALCAQIVCSRDLGIDLRLGAHTGDAARHGREYVGLAVHKAARLVRLADAGEIVLSAQALEALNGRTKDRLCFERLRGRRLKDFVDEDIYRLRVATSSAASMAEATSGY